MKQKKEEKLHLKKSTVQNLDNHLNSVSSNEQRTIKGGSTTMPPGTTDLAIFC